MNVPPTHPSMCHPPTPPCATHLPLHVPPTHPSILERCLSSQEGTDKTPNNSSNDST
ncbi:hypothetical protein DPMN_172938 [Dreissena polymorpha]|uniref:Uncharacterized protein n=1 Tax=Dreissena polymorpha TaxID=45954 RepID=A0A9D4E0P6_DREPO|nr:hypothetical protein DPMN_172938 [Dreissena polymorpha]